MKLAHESVILVVVPLLFVGAAGLLLFGGQRPLEMASLHFDQTEGTMSQPPAHPPEPQRAAAQPMSGAVLEALPAGLRAESSTRIVTSPFRERSDEQETHQAPGIRQGALNPVGSSRRKPLLGHVVGPDGQPLGSAHVRVTSNPNVLSGNRYQVLKGDADRFEVEVDESGSFQVLREPGRIYEITVESTGLAPAVVRRVAALQMLEIQLQLAGSVSGRVLSQVGNQPIPGARISLVALHRPPRFTTADALGHYQFSHVAPGQVLLRARHPAYQVSLAHFAQVAPGLDRAVDFSLQDGTILLGHVMQLGTNLALLGALVTIEDPTNQVIVFSGATDADGRFSVHTLAANHVYIAHVTDPSGAHGSMARIFSTDPAPPFSPLDLQMTLAEVATVTVRDAAGSPLAGSQVRLSATMFGVEVSGQVLTCDQRGEAVFHGLDSRARISLQGYKEGYALTVLPPVLLKVWLPEAQFELTLPGASSLSGNVQDLQQHPIAGALVRIVPVGQERFPLALISTLSDEHGNYSFHALPPLPMILVTVAPGFGVSTTRVSFLPGHEAPELNLILYPLE